MTLPARRLAGLVLASAMAGCGLTPPPSPSPTPAPLGPEPGQPYSASDILAAMRDSRRPDGVPDEIETESVAASVAESLWTFDGQPLAGLTAGGSCGEGICTLELAGAPGGAVGEDLWVFAVTPSSGEVQLVSTTLRGMPTEALTAADELLRELDQVPDGSALASGRWLPPPDTGVFVLSYRAGGEEGTCGTDVTLDVRARRVLDREIVNC